MSRAGILVVKLGAIGDVVLSLPMLGALRAQAPDASITVMIGRTAAPLLENNPAVDDIWIVDEDDFWKKRLIPLFLLLHAIRRRRFAEVFILQWSALFHVFFWLAGIPKRFGFSRDGRAFRLTRQVAYFEADPAFHDVDLYLALVPQTVPEQVSPKITLTSPERNTGEALWNSLGALPGQVRIVMAPGGGQNAKLVMPLKRWPSTYFATLADRLRAERNAFVVLVGSHEERALLETAGLSANRNLAGKITLRETAALIATGAFFIGNDSGLTHMAAAVGTRALTFFGPTSPDGKESRETRQTILYRREACSPCYRFGYAPPCPYQMKCLTQISVETAWQAFLGLEAAPVR